MRYYLKPCELIVYLDMVLPKLLLLSLCMVKRPFYPLYEGTARLKREQRRSLKLSLLVFLSLFFSFSYFRKIPRLRCRV